MNDRMISHDPVWLAKDIRREYSIPDEMPVDLDFLINDMKIHYKEVPMPEGYLGASRTHGMRKEVLISGQITEVGRKRFTIAHEIGHTFLHQGNHSCKKEYINLAFNTLPQETEANMFAAELLMPGAVIREVAGNKDVTIGLANGIAKRYGVSLQAALIALAKASPDIVYACCYTKEKVHWKIKSRHCELELRNKVRWPGAAESGKRKVHPENWFIDDDFPDDISCSEENYIYPNGTYCISIITLESEEW